MTSIEKKIGIEEYIKLHGGAINWSAHKPEKYDHTDEDFQDVERLWKIICDNKDVWGVFSTFASGNLKTEEYDELLVNDTDDSIKSRLDRYNGRNKMNFHRICEILNSLADAGLLQDLQSGGGPFTFRYKSQLIKTCVLTTGDALELKVYDMFREHMDECMIGVHLDWDGVIHDKFHEDVTNEIDVLGIKDGIPTFISCKSGKLDSKEVLYALYELDIVAHRFAGEQVNKKLVIINDISDIYKERAKEMGIEIIVL